MAMVPSPLARPPAGLMIIPNQTGQNDRMIESEPIRRRKLSHEILDRLLARITQGELAAGDHLPSERDLMSQYGVGRPAVREAMQALERMGFIAITHGERARIVAPTARTMIDQVALSARHLLATSATSLEQLKEARVFFEAGMVRIAAERASKADIARVCASDWRSTRRPRARLRCLPRSTSSCTRTWPSIARSRRSRAMPSTWR